MRKRKTVPTFPKICECCEVNYSSKKEDSRFCTDSCRVNHYQKQRRMGVTKTAKGFVCPKCNVADLYTPVGKMHKVIRCGTCRTEWGLNAKDAYN
jgi:hypothetical protein